MKVKYQGSQNPLPEELTRLGYHPSVEWHLDGHVNYTVYSISIWNDVLHYLVIPSEGRLPDWLPAVLFTIVDRRLPYEWYFRELGRNHPTGERIMVGYKEMVEDENHCVDLIERETNAIKIFLKWKHEIDQDS